MGTQIFRRDQSSKIHADFSTYVLRHVLGQNLNLYFVLRRNVLNLYRISENYMFTNITKATYND
jgi:hypothetical protein